MVFGVRAGGAWVGEQEPVWIVNATEGTAAGRGVKMSLAGSRFTAKLAQNDVGPVERCLCCRGFKQFIRIQYCWLPQAGGNFLPALSTIAE